MRNHPSPPKQVRGAVPAPVSLAHPPKLAAARLGIGKTMLFQLIDAKEIRTIKIGVRTLVPESELQRFIASRMEANG